MDFAEVEHGEDNGLLANCSASPSGENQATTSAQTKRQGLLIKWISIVSVFIVLVIGIACLAAPWRSTGVNADIGEAIELELEPTNLDLVTSMMGAWGNGDFNGEDAKHNLAQYFTDDVAVTMRYDFQNTDIYKSYTGIDGLARWCHNVLDIKMAGFKLTGFEDRNGTVIQEVSYTPTVLSTNRTATHAFHDFIMFTLKKGKICRIESTPGSPQELDSLFSGTLSNVDLVKSMNKAWGRGDFNGNRAKDNLAKYFTKDVTFNAFYNFKNTEMYKSYTGIDGCVRWCHNVLNIKMDGFAVTDFAGPRGTVIQHLTYTPTVLSTNKTAKKAFHDMLVFTFEHGKVSKVESHLSDPQELDSLFGDDVDVVMGMMGAWSKGDFSGDQAKDNLAKYFTKDVTFNAHYKFQHTDLYDSYIGIDGLVRWCQNIKKVDMAGFTVAAFVGPHGTVVQETSYTPTVSTTKKSAKTAFHDIIVFTVIDGKVNNIESYLGNPQELDNLFKPEI